MQVRAKLSCKISFRRNRRKNGIKTSHLEPPTAFNSQSSTNPSPDSTMAFLRVSCAAKSDTICRRISHKSSLNSNELKKQLYKISRQIAVRQPQTAQLQNILGWPKDHSIDQSLEESFALNDTWNRHKLHRSRDEEF